MCDLCEGVNICDLHVQHMFKQCRFRHYIGAQPKPESATQVHHPGEGQYQIAESGAMG